MRLAILSRDAPPTLGGIADHTARLAGSLALAGDEVTLVTRSPADGIPGVTVLSHPSFDKAPAKALAGRLIESDPEAIIWAYNPFSFGAKGLAGRGPRIARAVKGASGARLIVLAHELWFPPGREGARGMLWRYSQRRAGLAVFRTADRVIVTTPDRVAELAAEDISAVRIPVGSNLPDGVPPLPRSELGVPEDAFLLGHLGGLGPGHDLDLGLRAINAVDQAHLLLLGDTGPLPGLPDRVHTTGRIPADIAAGGLAACDAYLHLDHVGPTPGRRTALAAALQAGLPILGFDGEQTDRSLSDAYLLAPEISDTSLEATIRTAMQQPDIRAACGIAAKAYFERELTWTRITQAIRSVCTG
jgi:glycosyltransferase involved in cell wall biosynthesis